MTVLTSVFLLGTILNLAQPPTEQTEAAAVAYEEAPASCPVTKASDPPFIPPIPFETEGTAWIGSAKLWTFVPANGVWSGLPHYTPEDSRYRQKVFWWSEDFDWRVENPAEFTTTGRRLDGPSEPLTSDPHANAGWTNDANHPFIVDGIFIPTPGCWKITGRYKDAELSYVVWVPRDPRQTKCTPNELLAMLKPSDPAYEDAMELARMLQASGFAVNCVLQSKDIHAFVGLTGAAVFKTNFGMFTALFLPKSESFDGVEIAEQRRDGRFLYSARGSPSMTSPHPIDSAFPMYFEKYRNLMFIAEDKGLGANIVKVLR